MNLNVKTTFRCFICFVLFYALKKTQPRPPKSAFLTKTPHHPQTDIACGELELILAGLAEAAPQGNNDTDFVRAFFSDRSASAPVRVTVIGQER